MKKITYIALIFICLSVKAHTFEQVRKETLLKDLPKELITELTRYSFQQVRDEIIIAPNHLKALTRVEILSKNPLVEHLFEDAKSFGILLSMLSRTAYLPSARKCLDLASKLAIPPACDWVRDKYPLEKKLYTAACQGNLEVLTSLKEQGVSIDTPLGDTAETPLIEAVTQACNQKEKYLPIVNYLLEQGADVNAQTSESKTALKIAIDERNEALCIVLLAHNANPWIDDHYDDCPMDYVDKTNIPAIVRQKLKEVGQQFSLEQQLLFASKRGDFARVTSLLQKGACINIHDVNLRTPLMHFLLKSNKEAMRYLLERGAFVDAQDSRGETALMLAFLTLTGKECLDIVALLLEYNANLHVQDNLGQTITEYVRNNSKLINIQEVLEAYNLLEQTLAKNSPLIK